MRVLNLLASNQNREGKPYNIYINNIKYIFIIIIHHKGKIYGHSPKQVDTVY